jgi:molecular chaperone HscB
MRAGSRLKRFSAITRGIRTISCTIHRNLGNLDFYSLFHIDRTFGLSLSQLEHTFYSLQSESHPDRHVSSDEDVKARALSDSSDINKAYQTLREKYKRAKYLLSLYGYQVDQQKSVPPALLMTVMEAQEKLAEIDIQTAPHIRARLMEELEPLLERLEERRESLEEDFDRVAHQWDSAMHPETESELSDVEREQLGRITQLLAERAYIDTLHKSIHAAKRGESAMIRH